MGPRLSDWEDIQRRLSRVENQNRILKWLAAAITVAVVGAGVLMGQTPPGRTIEANSFVLKDLDGNVRASLAMVQGDPMLRLFDSAGRPRIVETVNLLGASVGLVDTAGKTRAALVATLVGDPSLTFADEEGKPRSVLAVANGAPGLALLDSARKTRVGLEVAATGIPDVWVADTDGKRRVVLGVAADGNPLVGLLDQNEQPRVSLGRNAYGDGLVLFGPNVKPAVSLAVYPTDPNGNATGNALAFWDLSAKRRLVLGTFTSANSPGIVAADKDEKIIWKAP
jgi:hypothetical protein